MFEIVAWIDFGLWEKKGGGAVKGEGRGLRGLRGNVVDMVVVVDLS